MTTYFLVTDGGDEICSFMGGGGGGQARGIGKSPKEVTVLIVPIWGQCGDMNV